jgi:hypothetical protein
MTDRPLHRPNLATWPAGVRRISVDELDCIGIDSDGNLYWQGKRVVTSARLDLDWWQTLIPVVIAIATVVGAAGAIAQGWASYSDWACKVGWTAICP